MAPMFLQLTERSTGEAIWINVNQILYLARAQEGSIVWLPVNNVFVNESVEKVMETIREAVETMVPLSDGNDGGMVEGEAKG